MLNALGDPVTARELAAALPRAPKGGVRSVDLLLGARQRGFDTALVAGSAEAIREEIADGRPVILMLRLLHVPGAGRDVHRRVREISPDDRDALNNLAWLLLERGTKLDEAERLAAEAASRPGPDRPPAQDTLGRIQLARGRCAEAARTFAEALASAEAVEDSLRAQLGEGLAQAERACAQAH